MEPSQEEAALGGPKEHTQIIVKGKRTKRQRPQSPILFVSTGSPMSSEGGDCVDNTQGQSKEPSRRVVIQEDHDNSNKFTSKRYLEGYCVYECKTCNKTFPSFQALGGHRASHKKLKLATAAAEEKPPLYKQFMFLPSSPEQEEGEFKKVSTFSLGNINIYGSNGNCKKQAKIHECSICGTEFTSGQALGGHMRRHRPPVAVGVKLESDDESTRLSANGLLSLDLDLNLPAPEEENRDHLFLLSSKQQHHHQKQSHAPIFVSGPAVVDCHY
ncbi:hypothetical protein EUGRSUZ_G02745 [Eucalyptus grandis]|uniref:Uncharacterized protein n=2 Tax=Eucalyptus grandis TaxID=71139 RepID=A0ACC3K6X5_EUCGR|nr:hypothetical protein EUGRSUZ_G02745 [Eucalyptus grandis]